MTKKGLRSVYYFRLNRAKSSTIHLLITGTSRNESRGKQDECVLYKGCRMTRATQMQLRRAHVYNMEE